MHLAQLNVALGKAAVDAPEMAEFVANLDRVNALGDAAPGFVWRLQDTTATPRRSTPTTTSG